MAEWVEIAVPVAPGDVEAVAEVMRRYSSGGVAIEEPLLSRDEPPVIDPDRPRFVKAYLRRDHHLPSLRRALRRDLARLDLSGPLPRLRGRVVREEHWAEAWRRYFDIERVGERVVVCPAWRRYRARSGEVVIRLDPGMAFGTGQHPTTRMCLVALERRVRAGCRLLDLGAGSGILAIAAAKLSAREVVALDTDPLAIAVAEKNVALNGVGGQVTVRPGSVGEKWPASPPFRPFDCLVANINADTIVRLAPALVAALREGGVGIVSGIIDEKEEGCRRALESAGARIVEVMADGDWRTLVFES
ncbi:MAG: 50S ribosomal protein L11 methyltransferase [Dehalococcoidia bacterium]|nr:50S ribosomal protein L11 methyltransferase [Dehalococcoidia bacterium]